LSQGRYFGGPAQLDLPVAGFDFQEIAFLEAASSMIGFGIRRPDYCPT
jgi:hypothetical protein